MHLRVTACVLFLGALAMASGPQETAPNQQMSACTFEDGGQVTVRYDSAQVRGDRLPDGRAWSPGDTPMYLFTSTAIRLGDTQIPIGAYSMYVIPEKHTWTLVVSKDVNSKKYDATQDLARGQMELGSLDQPEKMVDVAMGHTAPKQCSLRLYYGKTGAWAVFKEP